MADKLRKYKSLYSSTTNTFSTGESVTITPASVVGLPTDTEITLTFDRVDSSGTKTPSKMERIRGTIVGSNFVVSASGRAVEGTEQTHTSPVVEMVWNADDLNDIVDWGLVEHNQDGTHKTTKVISPTIVDAKGDLIVGSAADTPDRLAVGSDGYKLIANSNETTGLQYIAPDGWEFAFQTWTRESDNSFSEPIDATLKYKKGDKLKYKQGGGWKHQYVVSVGAYSGGKTIITTTGGSDFVFTSGTAITDNYYSHQENPIGFPAYFNYTSTIVGFSGTPTQICKFNLTNNGLITIYVYISGTSNSTSFTFTLPTGLLMLVTHWYVGARVADNGTNPLTPGMVGTGGNTSACNVFTAATGSGWTASGTKTLDSFCFSYFVY